MNLCNSPFKNLKGWRRGWTTSDDRKFQFNYVLCISFYWPSISSNLALIVISAFNIKREKENLVKMYSHFLCWAKVYTFPPGWIGWALSRPLPLNAGIYWDLLVGNIPFSIAAPLLWNALSGENRQVSPLSHLEVCKVPTLPPSNISLILLDALGKDGLGARFKFYFWLLFVWATQRFLS